MRSVRISMHAALKNYLSPNQLVKTSVCIDPLQFNIVMFPINVGNLHWSLMVFYPKSTVLCYYDSNQNIDISAINLFVRFILTSYKLHGHDANHENWLVLAPKKIPKQQDHCSCGIYVCMNAFYSVNPDARIFSAEDINNIRFWIVHRLLRSTGVAGTCRATMKFNAMHFK